MDPEYSGSEVGKLVEEVAGYLNFSSGASDPRFLGALNGLYGTLAEDAAKRGEPVWQTLAQLLRTGLEDLASRADAFRQVDQAAAALRLVFEETLPAYLRFHSDLLFHQTDASLFQPFFVGRVCEAVLAMGGPWEETERIVAGAIRRLNDFIGYRPVATLRSSQKMQPYAHEWVRPIPLYIRDAGVAWGRYHDLITLTIEFLRSTDPDILGQAWFDLDLLDELALDPRAYDFDHPVNRRPNYHFGGWDLHLIDNRGHYRRFVLQQVTLDGLSQRIDQRSDLPREELLWEAAAVLACTMLMGSGITGDGPEALDSSATLTTLVRRIAAYRDTYYERLLARLSGPRADRLRAEAQVLRQPFGGVRQHLNQSLARRRAEQLQHVHLARLFARMGYTQAAAEQAGIVPAASARMRCEIDCRMSAAHLDADRGRLTPAAASLPQIEDLLHRAIECGAMVDPWNILGFGGQFSRSPAIEDSVHDERVDDLIELVSDIFALGARLQGKAAASGDDSLAKQLSERMQSLARWWDPFASTEVGGVDGFSGREAWESSDQVAGALGAWQRAGTASGNIAFWREHAEEFRSPKAYALLVEALLDERDLVATMALLVHWLNQADAVALADGKHSFFELILRWMRELWQPATTSKQVRPDRRGDPEAKPAGAARRPADAHREPTAGSAPAADCWPLARKLLDYLESNAESFWQVPRLEIEGQSPSGVAEPDEPEDGEESEDLYGAAYENVVYRDTTDDGFEGEMLEGFSPTTDVELVAESERIGGRLAFLVAVARLWESTAVWSVPGRESLPDRDEVLFGYAAQAGVWAAQLTELLAAVHRYRVSPARGTHESLVEFDRQRIIKETLLEKIIAAYVEISDAARVIASVTEQESRVRPANDWELLAGRMLRALYRGQTEFARGIWPRLRQALGKQPLLYLPLVRGGSPLRIAQSRSVHRVLRRLLAALPRSGLLAETGDLLETIQRMERNHPAGPAAVTEFDRLFEIAAQGVLESVIASAAPSSAPRPKQRAETDDQRLIGLLEQPIESLLKRWLRHSRNVRVSVLEQVTDETRWEELRQFIERYGHDLFTQHFLTTYGKLRAVLHKGVDAYLRDLEEADDEEKPRLLADLDGPLSREHAVRCLELCLEAIVENYSEYLDYNSTTTQSDRGEMLYVLLDFLRLAATYESVAWKLKPVLLAHETLVRCGRDRAARRWREAVALRTSETADDQLRRFDELAARYGVRLRTVADRLRQRFVQPLAVDRLCALVRPAVEELRAGREPVSFTALLRELKPFTAEPGGIGFELPPWLDALEQEVDRVQSQHTDADELAAPVPQVAQVRLALDDIQRQIDSWDHAPRGKKP